MRDLLPAYARVALVVDYRSGARRGEVLQLRVKDVDLKSNGLSDRIRVPQRLRATRQNWKHSWLAAVGQNGSPNRYKVRDSYKAR